MADPRLEQLLAKLSRQREAFQGIPRQSAIEIVEEAIGKLLLLPGVESSMIAGGDTAASFLLSAIAPNVPFVPLEVKGLDLLLHAACALAEDKYKRAIAQGDAVS